MPRFGLNYRLIVPAILLFVLTVADQSIAQVKQDATPLATTPDTTAFSPNTSLDFSIRKFPAAPTIDGKINESVWYSATRVGNFSEISPGDNTQPPVRTEVLVAYDDKNLYIGVICYDPEPNKIRASITDRDNIGNDDFAGILIDTFQDQQTSYEFFVNPYGIQFDQRRLKNREDSSFDAVWKSAGEINSIGWTAEIEIPFRSLRFPNRAAQQWGVHFLRIRPRSSREQHSWAPLSRDESCLFCQAGTMSGIEGINTGRNLELLPYIIGSQFGALEDGDNPQSAFSNEPAEFDVGISAKYGLTPNLTLDATINPDFSQVESDAAQISLNTPFALFLDERRPFFLEGSDIFRSEINAVYTRSINDPNGAGKLTGKAGKNTAGYIIAQDAAASIIVPFEDNSNLVLAGESWSNIARYKRDFWSDSFVGLMATDRRYKDGANTAAGLDWDVTMLEKYSFSGQVLGSYTQEPDDSTLSEDFNGGTFDYGKYTTDFDGESFEGHAIEANFRRNSRHWNFHMFYEDFSPTFRADNGFIGRNNSRAGGMWNGITFQPDNRVFDALEPGLNIGRKYTYDGEFKDAWLQPQFFVRFKKQTWFWTGYLWSEERFKDVLITGIRRFLFETGSDFTRYLSLYFSTHLGRSVFRSPDVPFLAAERTFQITAVLKPTSRLRIDNDYRYQRFDQLDDSPNVIPHDDHKEYNFRSKLTYQFTHRLFVRIIGQYSKTSSDNGYVEFDPLISYKINPFTVFFVGSTHDFEDIRLDTSTGNPNYRQSTRTFFIKFQYLFRV